MMSVFISGSISKNILEINSKYKDSTSIFGMGR
jgi:hypothetical protein